VRRRHVRVSQEALNGHDRYSRGRQRGGVRVSQRVVVHARSIQAGASTRLAEASDQRGDAVVGALRGMSEHGILIGTIPRRQSVLLQDLRHAHRQGNCALGCPRLGLRDPAPSDGEADAYVRVRTPTGTGRRILQTQCTHRAQRPPISIGFPWARVVTAFASTAGSSKPSKPRAGDGRDATSITRRSSLSSTAIATRSRSRPRRTLTRHTEAWWPRAPSGAATSAGCAWFRYEVRRWRGGSIADLGAAVGGPHRLTSDPRVARRLLDAVTTVPAPVWGRDELDTGEMWNSARARAPQSDRACRLRASRPNP